MAKKLLVRTPQTNDGVTLRYDQQKQVVYKESVVELSARKNFEAWNAKLPSHLKHDLSEIEVEESPTSATNESLKKRLAELEVEQENANLRKRIDELEAEKAKGFTTKNEGLHFGTDPVVVDDKNAPVTQKPVAEVISLIQLAGNEEEIASLIEGDTRKTVLNAAKARREQLKG